MNIVSTTVTAGAACVLTSAQHQQQEQAIAGCKASSVAWPDKDQVAGRLRQYRERYSAEVDTQLERIADITRALENIAKATEPSGGGGQGRAMSILLSSLKDAQAQLREALLARDRLDLEIASWPSSAPKAY